MMHTPVLSARSPALLRLLCLGLVAMAASLLQASAPTLPLPEKCPPIVADLQASQISDRVQLGGFVGERVRGNATARLLNVDTERLLEGYRHRPGRQSWDGEHVGKWLHAATLAWVQSGDPALRVKMDRTAAELLKCQLADGYLGTYLPRDRWTEWDVWAHKYNLLGLLTYVRYTGNAEPLPACRRMADLLCNEFGDAAGAKDIITQGGTQHVGMASTSVLEPMVLLYRFTGEPRYLAFCNYIIRSWETPAGPHILSQLLAGKGVATVGDAKAYEMLSCLNGALELYRVTGERHLLDASLQAWKNIVENHLYLTGTASWREIFHEDHDLARANNTGETCVTVTWLQFNAHLLRLTGEARFAQQLECSILNQLLAGQRPDCKAWSYYVELEGIKRYSESLDGHCCLSSGPRGIALIHSFAMTTDAEGVVVNLYESGEARLILASGTPVRVAMQSLYPSDGRVALQLDPQHACTFSLRLRAPSWGDTMQVLVNGQAVQAPLGKDGYLRISRQWSTGDRVALSMPLQPRLIQGDHVNAGRAALCLGPLVFALDEASLAASGQSISTVRLAGLSARDLELTLERAPESGRAPASGLRLQASLIACRSNAGVRAGDRIRAVFVPFSEAGSKGSPYRIWVPMPPQGPSNLAPFGLASSSASHLDCRPVNDDNPGSNVEVMDSAGQQEIWFAVRLDSPATLTRVVYISGTEHWSETGIRRPGWFDASKGKPRIEVQLSPGAAWSSVGLLETYPPTDANSSAGVRDGQRFELILKDPVIACAVRVIGLPAAAGSPDYSRGSISELEAYGLPQIAGARTP